MMDAPMNDENAENSDCKPKKRGRPLGSKNKRGVAKINVHYRIDPRVDAALRQRGTIAATIEEWANRAGDDVLNAIKCDGPGIYTITNVLTGRRYIGSSKNMLKRWRTHRSVLDSGGHVNKELQQAWTDNEAHFRFGVLFVAPSKMTREMLYEKEREFIADGKGGGLYNGHPGGPRPGFGGKQPGAGRPVKPVGDKPVAIIVDPSTACKIDALRGDLSRAEYLRRLVDVPYCEQH